MCSTMFKCISMQNLIQIPYTLWFKSYEHFHILTTTGRADAQPCPLNKAVTCASGKANIYIYIEKMS